MTRAEPADLPPPQRLAVAYTPRPLRARMLALLAFDTQLGRLVAGTSEPMVGQIRLAWWREELAKPISSRALGNPVLEALGGEWTGEDAALIALVDGWEQLLGEVPLPAESIHAFAAGRGGAFAAFARLAGEPASADRSAAAGRRWALADLASRVSDRVERERCRELFRPGNARLPGALRGLAVLDGLASRAMARDKPLLAGRGAALAALRLGMFGR